MFPNLNISRKSKHKLLVIVGPTASGKSDLAVSLAKKLNGEVISADSRQVYRGMDIGTGKITQREMRGIRHHLLDVADPRRRFSAEDYRIMAHKAIDDIISRGKLPIICGGTGFYIDAVLDENLLPNVPPNPKLRKKLEKKTTASLLLVLSKLDPKRAASISASNSEKNNARRILRAIEIAFFQKKELDGQRRLTTSRSGEPNLKSVSSRSSIQNNYAPIFIGVKPSNNDLKKRIRARLEMRLAHGMLAEARRLHSPRNSKNPTGGISWRRMKELGLEYRYEALFLQGKMEKEEFVEKLNTAIWHYARRQMTWFKRNKEIRWFTPENSKNEKKK